MISELFHDLFEQAKRAEHVKIRIAMDLWNHAGIWDWPACGRLADAFIAEQELVDHDLMQIALRHNMKIRPDRPVCPLCQDPECGGYVLAGLDPEDMVVGIAIIKKYYGKAS